MALMDDLRTKLTAIGEAIREKSSEYGPLTMDEMPEAIRNIVGGGANNIENGYTVNFFDADSNLVQSHSAIYGNWVDQPISHLVDHWEDSAGHVHMFPLVVTADMGIEVVDVYEAGPSTWERTLYNHFKVDKLRYPYLAVMICSNSDSGGSAVIFSTNSSGFHVENSSNPYISFKGADHYTTGALYTMVIMPFTTPNHELLNIITNFSISDMQVDTTFSKPFLFPSKSTLKTYTNFEIEGSAGRLDQIFYKYTCEDRLYAHFGVDKNVYPRVIISNVYAGDSFKNVRIAFGKTDIVTSGAYNKFADGSSLNGTVTGIKLSGDVLTDVTTIVDGLSSSDLVTSEGAFEVNARPVYANWSYASDEYRLDQVLYL